MLKKTCEAFGIHKSHTTPYHPQGDGIVERANRSLLQMLRSYCSNTGDWEKWLPLLLFAYRTSQHSSTRNTPFTLMFGRNVKESLPFSSTNTAHDATSYKDHLQKRLAEMYDIVEANLVEAGL